MRDRNQAKAVAASSLCTDGLRVRRKRNESYVGGFGPVSQSAARCAHNIASRFYVRLRRTERGRERNFYVSRRPLDLNRVGRVRELQRVRAHGQRRQDQCRRQKKNYCRLTHHRYSEGFGGER